MLGDVVIAGAVRSAIGGFGGALAALPAPSLAGQVIRAAIHRAGVDPGLIEQVLLGNVLGAGLGQNIARQAALAAGLSPTIGGVTVNKVCGSGLAAIALAAQAIRCGDAEVLVAGGAENMSAAPYLLPKARSGYRMGHGQLIDAMIHDGLWDVYGQVHMGTYGDQCAVRYELTRKTQDDFAVSSYQRALAAAQAGIWTAEIAPVTAPAGKRSVEVREDEEPRRFNEEKMRQLRPAFAADGTVTAANASSINDGAAAAVVMAGSKADQLGIQPQARIVGWSWAAREPQWFTLAPIDAMQRLLDKVQWSVKMVDLFEINEAFSCVPLAAMRDLGIPHERVNVHGGAVALGHPIGASGARVLVTLLNAMRHRGARRGVAALCIGGGEGIAMAVEAV